MLLSIHVRVVCWHVIFLPFRYLSSWRVYVHNVHPAEKDRLHVVAL